MIQNLASKSFLSSLEASWISGSSKSDPSVSSSGEGSSARREDSDRERNLSTTENRGNQGVFSASFQGEPRSMQSNASTLREGCTVRGAFECDGDLLIDGFLEGDLLVGGLLTVSETATVRANVRASSVRVFGRVLGDISAEGKIELHSGSQVRGNIKAKRLLIQDGVIFDGRCAMLDANREVNQEAV